MSGESGKSGSGSFEKASAELEAAGVAPEVTWDKESPTGPPGMVRTRKYADWFQPILRHFQQIVDDESPFAELCLARAIKMVEEIHNSGLVGIDHFPEAGGGGGGGATRTNLVTASMPFACEFYRQATHSLMNRKDEFEAAYNEALALKKLVDGKKIVVAGKT